MSADTPIQVRCHGMEGRKRCPLVCTYVLYAKGWGPPSGWTPTAHQVFCPRHKAQATPPRIPRPQPKSGTRIPAPPRPDQPSLFAKEDT